jgi:integrase/recombinase XerD
MGLRDRALNGLMAYSLARVSAFLQMKVADYFVQGRRRWVRLHEKGGKSTTFPDTTILITFWMNICCRDIAVDASGYLFRTTAPKSGALTEKPMHQQDAYRMIQRRAKAAGIETKIGSYFPRDRHHRLPEEQRQTRSGAAYRQS